MDKKMNLTMLTDFYEITMANGYLIECSMDGACANVKQGTFLTLLRLEDALSERIGKLSLDGLLLRRNCFGNLDGFNRPGRFGVFNRFVRDNRLRLRHYFCYDRRLLLRLRLLYIKYDEQ